MKTLDNKKTILQYDRNSVADSIGKTAEQFLDASLAAKKLKIPVTYTTAENVIFCGMGGSNLASELLRGVFTGKIKKPFVLVRGYNLPDFASRNSLIFISSYSGNTEEVLSCFSQAVKIGAKIVCITAGGQLATMAKRRHLPVCLLDESNNPSKQPRYGLGLQLGAVLVLLIKAKVIFLGLKDESITSYLKKINRLFALDRPQRANPAKSLAQSFFGSMPIIVTADFLSANGHILANQVNESAKNLAFAYNIPELNHHLLEGLALPSSVSNKVKFLFFSSNLYSPKIKRRFAATQKVLTKQKIKFVDYFIDNENEFFSALEVLSFGSWLSFYLAILNKKNPASIPWVDWFKQELGH